MRGFSVTDVLGNVPRSDIVSTRWNVCSRIGIRIFRNPQWAMLSQYSPLLRRKPKNAQNRSIMGKDRNPAANSDWECGDKD